MKVIKQYTIDSQSTTELYIGDNLNIEEFLSNINNCVLVTDTIIFELFPQLFKHHNYVLIEGSCEANKTIDTALKVIDELIKYNIDRHCVLVGIGGGIVCDITGFCANIYMRGIKFGFVPTTLLAQIDAAVGGKNGINYKNYKNFLGHISQPDFILVDSKFLSTLSNEQYMSGLGEVFKYALLSEELFQFLIDNKEKILSRNIELMNILIERCIDFKLSVIQQDANDMSYRNILNLGHTFGHCIEMFEGVLHGLAIVKGILISIDLSIYLNLCDEKLKHRVEEVLVSFGFDINYNVQNKYFDILKNDKKKSNENINFVFLEKIGKPILRKIEIQKLKTLLL